jgi:Sigma-70, region 4
MAELDALPPDQRAAVQLLLTQGQSYDQLADLLKVDVAAVRRRAHDALDALGPDTRLDEDERAQVADYLLGQQDVTERASTRRLLSDSPGARGWARGVADSLRPLAGDALPEIPAAEAAEPEPEPEPEPEREPEREPEAEEPAPYEAAARAPEQPSSRLGGALLLAGIGIVVAVVLIILITGGGDDDGGSRTLSTRPSTTGTTPSRPVAQINLFSPRGGSRTVGLAQVYEMGNRRAIIVAGQGLPPGAYALWLYNSRASARLLGFVPQRVGRDGRFATQGELPGDANNFRRLVVTRENVSRSTRRPPTRPGAIALQGNLNQG